MQDCMHWGRVLSLSGCFILTAQCTYTLCSRAEYPNHSLIVIAWNSSTVVSIIVFVAKVHINTYMIISGVLYASLIFCLSGLVFRVKVKCNGIQSVGKLVRNHCTIVYCTPAVYETPKLNVMASSLWVNE